MPKKLHADSTAGFGGRLAELRKAAGVTQTALAAEIGISQRMMAYTKAPVHSPPPICCP